MLDLIDNKSKKIKGYKMLDLFIRIILTFGGSMSLLLVLMFLNSRLGVSLFDCFLITCIAPSIYSVFVNCSLEDFDKKIKNMQLELNELMCEYKTIEELDKKQECVKNSVIEKIELRFDGLSNERKIKLLKYIQNTFPENCSQCMSEFDKFDLFSGDKIEEVIYSRKREK